MPISVIAKEGKDKSKSRARGPRDTVYKDVLKGGKIPPQLKKFVMAKKKKAKMKKGK